MKFPDKILTKFSLPAILSISLLLAAACSDSNVPDSNANSNAVAANTEASVVPKDNAEELATLINLTQIPDEKEGEHAVWREETAASKGKKLTAVLKYNSENAAKIVSLAERHKPATETEIGTEEWFPEELTAQTQLSGNESLRGTVYGANDFYNAPYTNGRLIRIQNTNFFVLELTAF